MSKSARKMRVKVCVVALLSLTALGSPVSPAVRAQANTTAAPASEVLLKIDGEVERPLNLSAADLSKLPRRTVTGKDHGRAATFEGVMLVDVMRLAGVKFGEGLRGKNLELYLVVGASDGYKAVFALPELDPAFTDRVILLADKRDGKPLAGEEGWLRIVVPDEKRQARWVRQVISLTVRRA